jgi:flagellar motor switch protein FliG
MALAVDSVAIGGIKYATEILEKSFGASKANQTLKRIQSQLADSAGLHRLRSADPQQLATSLRGEHPQTIALVLAHLDSQQTATILKEFDPVLGGDVMYRIGCMEKVAPEMMQMIEKALGNEADLSFTRGLRAAGGPEAVANVLNHVVGSLEKDLLDRISEKDADLCEQIKNLMFVFEDILRLDDRSLQRVLREIEARVLSLALKNASEELKGRILGGMSQRAVTALKDEMSMLGAVRLRDVEAAQAQIVAQVRALEAAARFSCRVAERKMRSSSKGSLLLDAAAAAPAAAWSLNELGRATTVSTHSQMLRAEEAAAEAQRAEHEQRVQEAYASGYEEGRLEGEIAEGVRLRNAVTVAEQALAELRENEARWQDNVEANIAALAVAVARHILMRELASDPTIVADLVKRALHEFPIDQPLRVRVNPTDLSVLSTHTTKSGEPIAIAPNRDVHWLADARIQPGGCVVEGRERIIDGRVDTALERLYRQVTDTNV